MSEHTTAIAPKGSGKTPARDLGKVLSGPEPEQAPAPAADGPTPFLQGTFALYVTPSGDVVLSAYTDAAGSQQVKVPRFVVNQARRQNPTIAAMLDAAKGS